jgi:hypothetical protein
MHFMCTFGMVDALFLPDSSHQRTVCHHATARALVIYDGVGTSPEDNAAELAIRI